MRPLAMRTRSMACALTCLGLLAAGQAGAAEPQGLRSSQVSPSEAGGTGRAVPSCNLLQNPGAEAGVEGGLPFWDTTPGFVAELYGNEFRPPVEISQQIGGGAQLFAGGSDANVSAGTQVVDVSSAASVIDTGAVVAHLSAYLGGIDDEEDYADVTVAFLPASGDQPLIPPARIGPVTAADRGFQTNLLRRATDRALPAGTRRILITITSTRLVGIYTDGYADNLALSLTEEPVSLSTRIVSIDVDGSAVTGTIRARVPCRDNRRVVITKGAKTIGSSRSTGTGKFSIKLNKHTRASLKVEVRSRTVGTVTCKAGTKKIPGLH